MQRKLGGRADSRQDGEVETVKEKSDETPTDDEKFTGPPAYLDFCHHKYTIEDVIGEGTFSTVYRARCTETGAQVALKCITQTSAPNRVLEELTIIKTLNGENNCIRLLDVLRNADQIVAVFPLIPESDFKDFLTHCSFFDIRNYMHNLLKAVHHVHCHSIIHRDIKPSNFMYNIEAATGCLIDFGLAQHEKKKTAEKQRREPPILFFNSIVIPSKPPGFYEKDTRPQMKAPRAGTRGFRAPEVLFRYEFQTRAIDMWSVGVILLCIMTAQYPFFLSMEDIDNLVEMALIFGHAEMRRTAKLYGRVWKSNISTVGEERTPLSVLTKRLNPNCEFDEKLLDLLESLLDLNCHTRITAEEALSHPFFH